MTPSGGLRGAAGAGSGVMQPGAREVTQVVGVAREEADLRRRLARHRLTRPLHEGADQRADRERRGGDERRPLAVLRDHARARGHRHAARRRLERRRADPGRGEAHALLEPAARVAEVEMALEDLLLEHGELVVQAQRRPLSCTFTRAAHHRWVTAGHIHSDDIGRWRLGLSPTCSVATCGIRSRRRRARSALRSRWRRGSGHGHRGEERLRVLVLGVRVHLLGRPDLHQLARGS